MHRDILIDQLRDYKSKWPAEADTADQFIAFITTNPDCFERSLKVGHVTGSAWVVNQTGTHVLMTHHRKLNRWFQLGGHADGNADILRVAEREAREESGLENVEPIMTGIFDIDLHVIPARGQEPEHFHYDIRYVFQSNGGDDISVSEESHDVRWIDIDDLQDFTRDESVLRMAEKWKRRSNP
jgi:8-oxo-dGTP pyrophosphatase MutT (NUDIX family)